MKDKSLQLQWKYAAGSQMVYHNYFDDLLISFFPTMVPVWYHHAALPL